MEQVGLEAFEGSLAPERTMSQSTQEEVVQKLAIGNVVPDFVCCDESGAEHRLSDFRGRKVMLCFYRNSYCPVVANSIGKLVGNYKKLAWASKLKVVTVFRTTKKCLKDGLHCPEAPIPHFIGDTSYPFLALVDPDGTAASLFKVESKSFSLHLLDFEQRRFPKEVISCFKHFLRKNEEEANCSPGASSLLPSEFLVDERGVLVDVMRSRKASDTMALDRITNFLLRGEKEKRSTSKGKI